MTSFIKNCCILGLLVVPIKQSMAQIDSTKANNEMVKQEMAEMLNKLDAFLAQNAPNNTNTSLYAQINENINSYKDSLAKIIGNQQQEINELNSRIKTLEEKNMKIPEVVDKKFENLIGILYFEVGSYNLTEENKKIIKKLVQENNDKTLQLVAYTDWTGDNETNQKLSDKRALSVQNELILNGFQMQNLKTYSKGKMAEEKNNLSAKECRRVEIRY